MIAVLLLALGPCLGSFASLAAGRMAAGVPFAAGRSRCDGCGAPLAARDLVPLASWMALGGHARCCRTAIAARLPLTEVAFLAVPAMALALGMDGTLLIATCGLGWTLFALALVDVETFRLPDALTLPLAAAGLALASAGMTGPLPAHAAAAALALGLVVGIDAAWRAARRMPGMGMGDAKLLMAAGAWTGLAGLVSTLLLGCLFGLIWGVVAQRVRHGVQADNSVPAGAFPFGPALALGFWTTWTLGPVVPA